MFTKGEKLMLLPGNVEVTFFKNKPDCTLYVIVTMPNGKTKEVYKGRLEKINS